MLQKNGNPISNAGIKTGTVDDYRRLTDESAVTITPSNDRISERLSNEFHKWHGMSVIADKISLAVDSANTGKGKVNGWAILSVVLGVDEVFRRLGDNLNLVVLVCGLLIGTSLSMASSQPSQFAGTDDQTNLKLQATWYISFAIAAICCHFFCIIISIQFLQAMNTCARDADKWRIILSLDWIPTVVYTVFILGNFAIASAIGISMAPIYGEAAGYCSAAVLILTCGIFLTILNRAYFLHEVHAAHGWYKTHNAEYDIEIPLAEIEKLANFDREYKSCKRSNTQDR